MNWSKNPVTNSQIISKYAPLPGRSSEQVKCRIEYHAEKSTTHKLCCYARAGGSKCDKTFQGHSEGFNFTLQKCCSAFRVILHSCLKEHRNL